MPALVRAYRLWTSSGLTPFARPALLNGAAGFVVAPHGEPFSVLGITVAHGKIVEIDVVADPERLRQLDLTVLDQ
jgi:RNA polymerase sigma-70 factor (ECF subfamily)